MTADYTFVNERLAKHYGIPNIYGPQFRRVQLGQDLDMRRGLLGKGALLTVTSQPARTSPVSRGKWFLQTFLGVSPPDPPPNVPAIKPKVDDNGSGNVKELTMREQMDQHHANPVCATCHRIFEPIGLAMENYDAIGSWRTTVDGSPIDVTGVLVDGTKVDGVVSLRDVLVRYQDQFVRVVTERLLTYALGRGVEYQDMPLVRSIVRDAAKDKYRFSSLVMGIVKSASVPDEYQGIRNDSTGGSLRGDWIHVYYQAAYSPTDLPARRGCHPGAAVARFDGAGRDAAGPDGRGAETAVRRHLHSARRGARLSRADRRVAAGLDGDGRQADRDAVHLQDARAVDEPDGDSERHSLPVGRAAARPEPGRPLGGVGVPVRATSRSGPPARTCGTGRRSIRSSRRRSARKT